MANSKFLIGRFNDNGTVTEASYYIAGTDAGKPSSGLNVGDLCWAVDSQQLYVAISSTEWHGKVVLVGASGDPPSVNQAAKINNTYSAAVASRTLINSTAPAGVWRVNYYLHCTTSDATAGTITLTTSYTNFMGATTDTSAAIVLTSTASRQQGVFVIYNTTGAVSWNTTLAGIMGTSQYQVRMRCDYLG